ncbi:hypothetical protein M4D55_07025 [Metabacillus idriensis]|uniref:hypothetical protein n=1 Tax=Metabacillus idriensis TaxID=324768 RepID=UPI0020400833|nr:hypothetical protein [Metabacillus idriensis]MCM3595545.1 hypothetical protein [Metabacillus idriensis]
MRTEIQNAGCKMESNALYEDRNPERRLQNGVNRAVWGQKSRMQAAKKESTTLYEDKNPERRLQNGINQAV